MDPTSIYLISGRSRHANKIVADHAYIHILHELPLTSMRLRSLKGYKVVILHFRLNVKTQARITLQILLFLFRLMPLGMQCTSF